MCRIISVMQNEITMKFFSIFVILAFSITTNAEEETVEKQLSQLGEFCSQMSEKFTSNYLDGPFFNIEGYGAIRHSVYTKSKDEALADIDGMLLILVEALFNMYFQETDSEIKDRIKNKLSNLRRLLPEENGDSSNQMLHLIKKVELHNKKTQSDT